MSAHSGILEESSCCLGRRQCRSHYRGPERYPGGVAYDSADTTSGGNAALILAHQLIAAQLNFDTGSVFTPDPSGPIRIDANSLLSGACGTTGLPGCFVKASSPVGQQMVNDAATLDAFNSGTLTPSCIPRTG